MPKRAFAIGAHPDDIEFMMAGTLILLKRAGYEIHYLNIANGSYGSAVYPPELVAAIRTEEAKRAAALIGAVYHPPVVDDLEVFFEKPLLAKVSSIVREVAPDILLTLSPTDYMEDHTNACRLAVTAAFVRSITYFPVDPPQKPTSQAVTVYHAQPYGNRDEFDQVIDPGIFVNISEVVDEKTAMLAEHKSQKDWLDQSQGLDTYLIEMQRQAREVGEMSGRFEYAEGWRRRSHRGFCPADADPLSEALGADATIRRAD